MSTQETMLLLYPLPVKRKKKFCPGKQSIVIKKRSFDSPNITVLLITYLL